MSFSKKIIELRKERKWSQNDVADKLGIDYRNVSRWETERNIPTIDVVIKLAKIFEVTTDYLLLDSVPRNGKRISVDDKDLVSFIEELPNIQKEDKEAIKRLVDAVIFKNKVGKLSKT